MKPSEVYTRAAEFIDGNVHVMPSDEEHYENENCWCNPTLQEDFTEDGGKKVFVHNRRQ